MTITNYKRLEPDRIYTVEDSEGELHRLQFRGFHFCPDWREDELVFWVPGTRDVVSWPACEYQGAIIDPE